MSILRTEVLPFKATAFKDGDFINISEANAPWFYADRSWKQDRVFHVLTDVQHIHEGGL